MVLMWILESKNVIETSIETARYSRELGDNMFSRKGAVYRHIKLSVPENTPIYKLNLATELAITLDELDCKA